MDEEVEAFKVGIFKKILPRAVIMLPFKPRSIGHLEIRGALRRLDY